MNRENSGAASRLIKLCGALAAILAAGLAYALFIRLTGLAVPCLFRTLTGYQCAGCGMTRLCMALLRLDFKSAWEANPMIILLSPLAAATALDLAVRYVKDSEKRCDKFVCVSAVLMAAAMLVFGVVRNVVPL